jgi:hypothetical protein
MQETGFLGTAASRAADITLLLEMGMGAGLLAGALLARAGRIRIHAACQSVIVLLNLALIVLTMFPVFHRQVLPKLSGRIGKPYYALAATHAALGGVAAFCKQLILKNMFVGHFGIARTETASRKKEKREQASRTPNRVFY